VFSLAFSRGERPHWLALSSDKGTVHVFSLDQRQPSPGAEAAAVAAAASSGGAGGAPPEPPAALRNPVSPFSFVSVRVFSPTSSFHFRFTRAAFVSRCTTEPPFMHGAQGRDSKLHYNRGCFA
jgi:hypothetical protein